MMAGSRRGGTLRTVRRIREAPSVESLQIKNITAQCRHWEAGRDHQQVLFAEHPECGYRAVIAIHDTTMGAAIGGTRMWAYESDNAAIMDALRLSRGMTFVNAIAGLSFGGGKSVILATRPCGDRTALLRAHGRFVNALGGAFITAEGAGTSVADMEIIATETRWVAGRLTVSGDRSPDTARGVVRAMEATANEIWGNASLAGRTAAVQGLGNVGRLVCQRLAKSGARLVVCDVDAAKTDMARDAWNAMVVAPDAIYDAEADLFVPCALGAVLNGETIPRLRVRGIAGAASNQLLHAVHAQAIAKRRIVYAPDFVANAGGVIGESGPAMEWTREETDERIDAIYDAVTSIFVLARSMDMNTHVTAESLARSRIATARR